MSLCLFTGSLCIFSAGVGGPQDLWTPQPVSSSLESSTSSQEHLNFSNSSTSSNKGQNQRTGAGRWKTPNTPHVVPPHSVQAPSRSDLPPPPPPPPAAYPDAYDPQTDLPLPPPPTAISPVAAQQAADRKKREEQQRWYEKEKARLEEERWARRLTTNTLMDLNWVAMLQSCVFLFKVVILQSYVIRNYIFTCVVCVVDVSGRERGGNRRGSWVRSGPTPSCPSNLTTTEEPCLLLITSPLWPPWPRPSLTSPRSLSLPLPDPKSCPACRGQRCLPPPVPPTLQVAHLAQTFLWFHLD